MLLYVVRLAQICNVDLSEAVLAKIEQNSRKYPADVFRGKWMKYTEYPQNQAEKEEDSAK